MYEIYNVCEQTLYTIRDRAIKSRIPIDWEQEEIIKVLAERLEGFEFYENF